MTFKNNYYFKPKFKIGALRKILKNRLNNEECLTEKRTKAHSRLSDFQTMLD